ncbi:acidocalcisomal pyrophosphatase [Leptomonas pyrrhocoris]|uniref:inorganic diphosphatase n=1 Tax=Leptomonas pyrrhocoris TaxID=157538 RepID=A0A0N0DT31_LEPPY|nr:acidocalcisomal pyrophosphatase [Leptomonas pyrrhocoris]KPA76912.1 acidocalcisomal pyrophosphatase [Leptomonas pyrrhocoris]|eukprot:XP_015655351.1 acidocalcisomal pyrophosphatase [Leptomonas pyrrhocoris]
MKNDSDGFAEQAPRHANPQPRTVKPSPKVFAVSRAPAANLGSSMNPDVHSYGAWESVTSDANPMSPTLQEVKYITPQVRQFGTGLSAHGSTNDLAAHEDAKTDGEVDADKDAVTEFDLVAYSKEDHTHTLQKSIMSRMFSAFDVTQLGYLDSAKVKEFCAYAGRNMTFEQSENMLADLKSIDDNITFEVFWNWWVSHPNTKMTKETFSLVSADFSVPYHQQQLKVKEEGEIFTPSYRVKYYFKDLENGYRRQVSPWHDVPLYVRDPVRTKPEHIRANRYNFVCEIPKWTRAKFEIATGEPFNPIKQDIKNGVPRFYKHGDMMWNYGAFPQTWESTEVIFEDGVSGDNDPIDGVEIGMRQLRVGEIHPVKILGVLGMIDDGQMDWKVICISVNDPISRFMKDIDDVPKFLPGCLDALREWFRVYKICQGGVENKFAFNGEYKDKSYAMKVVDESHYMWENLRKIKGKEKV